MEVAPVYLAQLLKNPALETFYLTGPGGDTLVTGIVSDHRQVTAGSLFVALVGSHSNGHSFIPEAIQRGAVAVAGSEDIVGLPVPYLRVEDGRRALAHLAAAFFGFPARRMTVIGVTGTDGKTTTCKMLYKILQSAGFRVGMITTVGAMIAEQVLDTGFHVTTPEAPQVQQYLREMKANGLTHVILEATSHGLAQHRVEACEFDIGVVTNITHEHLDYHGSFEAYRKAKARLFSGLAETNEKPQGNPRLAVLNRDDNSFGYLAEITTVKKISYGIIAPADYRAVQVEHSPQGLRFILEGEGLELPIRCRLMGQFNVYNCLAAAAAAWEGLRLEPEAIQRGLAELDGVPGRMECIDLGQDFTAVVDFAHTPNALRCALETARQIASNHVPAGRVIAVFGSAGLRDRQKRRLMAEVSADLAELTVLTAEDPRTEPLDGILAEMAAGISEAGRIEGKSFWRIPDRGEALRLAIKLAHPGDVVIACGKGHETSMCFGDVEYPWDERQAMRAAISEKLAIPGPEMPYLPTQS